MGPQQLTSCSWSLAVVSLDSLQLIFLASCSWLSEPPEAHLLQLTSCSWSSWSLTSAGLPGLLHLTLWNPCSWPGLLLLSLWTKCSWPCLLLLFLWTQCSWLTSWPLVANSLSPCSWPPGLLQLASWHLTANFLIAFSWFSASGLRTTGTEFGYSLHANSILPEP